MTNSTSACPYILDILSSNVFALLTTEGSQDGRNPHEVDIESESSAAVPSRRQLQVARKRRARAMALVDRDSRRKRMRMRHDRQNQSTSHRESHQHQHRPSMVSRRGTGPAEAARALDLEPTRRNSIWIRKIVSLMTCNIRMTHVTKVTVKRKPLTRPRKRSESAVVGEYNVESLAKKTRPTTLPDNPLTLHRLSTLTCHRCGLLWKGES